MRVEAEEHDMHVPDGFLNVQTSIATGIVAASAVTVALRRSRAELDERTAPLAGLTAAFIFAVQMLNFPVGIGTSGHLMGGALAAALVGPWTAVLCVSVVLVVQALLFADGGLTALGTNITLMAVVTVAASWAVMKLVLSALPKRLPAVAPAAAIGALVSVPAAAGVFVVLYSLGGEASLPIGALVVSMLGWHTLIGIGEAVITGLTVAAVVAVRPDLVYAARGLRPVLRLRRPDGSTVAVPVEQRTGRQPRPVWNVVITGTAVALFLAGVVSVYANENPDGLEYVSSEHGFLATAREHLFGGSALADYGAVGGIPVGLAGVLGALITIALGWAVFRWASRRSQVAKTATSSRSMGS
jgi:cobalt/nickel transport system permease protein